LEQWYPETVNNVISKHTLDTHTHGTGTNHTVSYKVAGLDTLPGTLGDNDTSWTAQRGCADCHGSSSLVDGTDISGVHTACAKCHSYDDSGATSKALVDAAIAAPGTAASCDTCHEEKTPNVDHGGHAATVFDWTASCGTASCHDSVTNTDIATDLHTCTTCHASKAGGLGTTIVGAGANGEDGDARLGAALGDYTLATCTTCHDSGTYTWEAIHTETATAVDHETAVAATTDSSCETCHTGTGSNVAIALDNGSGRTADMLHDVCTSCHTTDGSLDTAKDGTGLVLGTMASGNCTQCHTADIFDRPAHGAGQNQSGP